MNRAFGWMSDTRPINGCEDYTVYLLPVSCGYRTMEAGDPADFTVLDLGAQYLSLIHI